MRLKHKFFFFIKVNIWEERKVFGSSGQILKEEILRKLPDNGGVVPLNLVSSEFICQ